MFTKLVYDKCWNIKYIISDLKIKKILQYNIDYFFYLLNLFLKVHNLSKWKLEIFFKKERERKSKISGFCELFIW